MAKMNSQKIPNFSSKSLEQPKFSYDIYRIYQLVYIFREKFGGTYLLKLDMSISYDPTNLLVGI